MEKLIKNATIIYKNGFKKFCDAISITEKGVYTGHLKSSNNMEFINSNFIPMDQIKKIFVFNENGKQKNLDFGEK